MRYIIFFTFFILSLYAKSEDACYSVSLLSVPDTKQNSKKLLNNKYPLASCKIMSISNMLTVRCGCYEKMSEARQSVALIEKKYKFPVQIVSTYKYRFADMLKQKSELMQVTRVTELVKKVPKRVKKEETLKVAEPLKQAPANVISQETNKDKTALKYEAEAQGHIDVTLLARYLSNKNFYKHSPYYFALFESDYQGNNFSIYGGLAFQNRQENEELLINHLYGEYFGDNYTFKIGKMVQKIGVLDYFSTLDTLNPPRNEFFDDSQLEIKKIPLWMSSVDYFVNDSLKLTAIVQPYDVKHQNYTGLYTDYILNQFIPEYFKNFFTQKPLGQELFYPLYTDSLVPYVQSDVANKSGAEHIAWDKLSYAFVSEYSDDSKKIGAVYFNRYSEIPMIKVDQNLLDAAIAYDNGKNPNAELSNYIQSGKYDLIKSVNNFRYQQFGLYGETTLNSFGLRTELGYRDKIPLFNDFSGMATAGGAVDYLGSSVYNALEMQYVYLEKYHKSAYVAMFRTRFSKQMLWRFSWYFENALIAAHVDNYNEYAIVPNLTMSYKQLDFSFEGIVSQKNTKANTLSILLRGRF